ncbi:MAG TPA: TonB-dependent receptor, partial [Sphingopyxis sp.]|nr:TonB-dependent receptor [Sphingopyxis sp.]
MKHSIFLGGLLLTSALVAPAALAQTAGQPVPPPSGAPEPTATPQDPDPAEEQTEEPEQSIEISAPGAAPVAGEGDIVITGTRSRNIIRQTPQVVSVLSAEDIARTGEGDIAGALQRVTGLSVVGNGFVFVRGLGDRYSLALLNGSPLPSPEPLRRVVPLDIFPTSVIASSLVQKSYSVAYPGEFGGGVINLTTPAIPRETFLEIGASTSADTESNYQLGYSYYGSELDWLGFDDGSRDFPSALAAAARAGTVNSGTDASRRDFAMSLTNARTTVLQRLGDVPGNFSGEISGGTSFDIGTVNLGLIASFGYSNSWRARDAIQQTSNDPELAGIPQTDFESVTTDNRVLVNGLVGVGASFGEHRIRWTNLFIRDSLKQGRLSAGSNRNVIDQDPNLPPSLIEQNSYWFERQLFTTQLVGEFDFGDLNVSVRGAYANSQRESPYERAFSYRYIGDGDPTTRGADNFDDYVNDLSSAGQFATIAFSDLNENVYSGSADFSYRFREPIPITVSGGYYYLDTSRDSERFAFRYFSPDGALPAAVAQERPDFLVSDYNVQTYNIQLRDVSGAEGTSAYTADLRVHAGYAQVEIEPTSALRITAGVRYEDADQSVLPVGATLAATQLSNSYWLPAATLTWEIVPNLQFRLHGSRTIARPQFRELAPQVYQDFESDREYTGNPFLTDSELTNAE